MALVVQVPLNTVLADLDEGLRTLLRRELERHGFEGVEIAFDAPSSDWSGQLTGPAVNLFLYDLREFSEGQDRTPTETRDGNGARMTPPPLRLEVTYAITAWTQAVEDEHRLLSQVLAVLFSYRNLPAEVLGDRLANNGRHPIEGTIGRPADREGRLLDLGRRALQGVARLRGARDRRVGRGLHPRPRGPDPARAHAPQRRAARRGPRAAPLRRQAARRRRRSRSPTRGSRCPTPGAGRRPTATAASSSTASSRASTTWWRARSTAARWRPTSRSPARPWTS